GALKYRQPDERLQLVQSVAARAGGQLPDDLMMTAAQVQALRQGGMTIGAHTVSHPILAVLDESAARLQIEQSRAKLQCLLGERVAHFAYPNGVPGRDFTDATAKLVRSMGFDSAVTTGWGAARRGADLFQLPRFTPWDQTPNRFVARMARNLLSS
ncbi:MAG: carbohydrate esterase family protein, partial [Burkholderiales bacterium PBB5]